MSGSFNKAVLCLIIAGAVLASLFGTPALAARPVVKKIETKSESDKFTLRVFLNARLAPKVFPLDVKGKNPRIVVDFKNASGLKSLPARINSSSSLVRSVRVGIHKGAAPKVRLVLDLVPGLVYQVDQWFRRDKNRYILVLTAR